MKKQKGFTLVELLAVIVILGILISLSTVAIANINKKQQQKNLENVISSILTGAKSYNAEERIEDGIMVSELIDSGYVDYDSKYDLPSDYVIKESCLDNKLKTQYMLLKETKVEDDVEKKIYYTDCGCDEQKVEEGSSLISAELCIIEKDS